MNARWWGLTKDRILAHAGRWGSLFRGRTLSRRLLVPILPAVVFVTVALGAVSYAVVRRQIVIGVRGAIGAEARNAAREIEGVMARRLAESAALARSPILPDYIRVERAGRARDAEGRRREIERAFEGLAVASGGYAEIVFVDAQGRRIASMNPPPEGARQGAALPDGAWAALRTGGTVESPPRLSTGGLWVKRAANPVFDKGGAFLGAIVTDTDLRVLEAVLEHARVGRMGGAFLEDASGRVLAGRPPRVPGKGVSARVPVRLAPGGAAPEVPGWTVVVQGAAQEHLIPALAKIFWATLILGLLAIGFLVAVIVSRVGDLMGPIQGVVEGTRRFAAGDLTFRFPSLPSLELDGMASSFNRMAETLEARSRELEQRIRQLTALKDMEEAVIQRQDEETVLRLCLEAVARGFAFDRTGLYWVDAAHKAIVGRFLFGSDATGFSEIAFKKRRVALGGGDLLNEVVRTRAAVIIRNPADDARVNMGFVTEARTREFVIAPICGKERVLGVLTADNLHSGRPLREEDKEGLTLYANAVGLALENAQLFQNLTEGESRLRTVLENSPEAIIGLSREHWINTWNRGAELIFGLTPPEALGKPLTVLFPKTAGPDFKRLLNQVIEKGSVRDVDMPGRTKDGRVLDLSVSWGGQHPDFWMNKEWTLVIRDVTSARRLQNQLIRSEKLSAVGQLISGIAHELNNPLQAVVGYADILGEDLRRRSEGAESAVAVSPEEVLHDLRIITENAMRCQKIIENLLLFVRQGEIERRPVDLARAVQASRDLLQYKLKKAANVQVEVDIPPECPAVHGNFQQIQQVFVNVINNACDAMAGATTSSPRLRVSARRSANGFVHVEVADTGPGIPEAVRDRLFEPFFTTKAEGRGTGLGLPVCRQIIEDHGGRIGFTTELGQGTRFWFDLPPAREEPVPAPAPVHFIAPVRDKTVLIVDDEPDVLGFLSKVVHADGNVIELASSLREAIGKAAARKFDLVVTDIRLGEGTGLSLHENWNLWTSHPRPAFLMMTGDVLNAAVLKDIEQRGLHLLHKPIDIATFQGAIRAALGLGALNSSVTKI